MAGPREPKVAVVGEAWARAGSEGADGVGVDPAVGGGAAEVASDGRTTKHPTV